MKLDGILNSRRVLLLGIFILALFLRGWQLGSIPPGLNRDEASIGYIAYSILQTGRDEHGKWLPISLQSFGDWKLPLYVYVSIPFIKFLSLSEISVRLPSVVFGVVTIFLLYKIIRHLFPKQTKLALMSSLILAISPWHIFFSRVTSEANLAVFCVTLSLYLITRSFRQKMLLPFAMIFLSLSMIAYHGNHIFTPLLFIGLIITFRKLFLKSWWGRGSALIFIIFSIIVFSQTLFSADRTKISGLLPLNDISLVHEQIDKNRVIYQNSLLGKMLNNKLIFAVEQISRGYVRAFSPDFLFIKGGSNQQHNIPDFGNLYLIEAPFLLLGIIFCIKNKEKYGPLLLYWLLISPVGAALTKDAPHSARMFAIFPMLSVVIAYAVISITTLSIRPIFKKVAFVFIALALSANFVLFLSRYYILFPYKSYAVWGDAQKKMVEKLSKYKQLYSSIYVAKPENSLYIYSLFFNRPDPAFVQKSMIYYPVTSEGFEHVKSFDGIEYQKLDWTLNLLIPGRLYVDYSDAIPPNATNSAAIIKKTDIELLKKNGYDTSGISEGDVVVSRQIDQIYGPDKTSIISFIDTIKASPTASPAAFQ